MDLPNKITQEPKKNTISISNIIFWILTFLVYIILLFLEDMFQSRSFAVLFAAFSDLIAIPICLLIGWLTANIFQKKAQGILIMCATLLPIFSLLMHLFFK
jgi:hypothetical protein